MEQSSPKRQSQLGSKQGLFQNESRLEQTAATQELNNVDRNIQNQQEPSKGKTRTQLDILMASSLSCIITMTLTNPLEVVKLKAQYSPMSCSRYPHPSFKDLYNCACTKFNVKDSFKGLHLNLFQGLISAVLYMQVYEYCRANFLSLMASKKSHNEPITNFQSGVATLGSAFTARILVTSLLVPIEAMRVKFTNTSTPVFEQNILSSATNKGLKVTMFRDLSYSCLLWFTIESIRNALVGSEYRFSPKPKGQEDQPGKKTILSQSMHRLLYANVIPAFIGANLISVITTPLDTVKTRIQSGIDLGEGNRIFGQMKKIYRQEGLTGLFAGVQYRAVKNSLSSVCYITMYQYFLEKASLRKSFPAPE